MSELLVKNSKDFKPTPAPKFFLGVDAYDPKVQSLCLVKVDYKGVREIILTKTMSNKKKFDKTVLSIVEIFEATMIKEG